MKFIKKHKFITIIAVLALIGVGYYFFRPGGNTAVVQYITGAATKGTLAVAVSGSGQVQVLNQVDVKPKVSGDVIYLGVAQGQYVAAGGLIAKLDTTDAEKAVRDARMNLESAQLSMEKLKASSADIGVILESSFSDISNAFLDFPAIISNAQTIILGNTLNPGYQDNVGYYNNFVGQLDQVNYPKIEILVLSASNDYAAARSLYDATFALYKTVLRDSNQATIQDLLTKTIATAKALGQALKSEQNLLDFLADYAPEHNKAVPSLFTSYKATLKTNTGLMNGHLSNLSSDNNSIANAPRDIRSQELSLEQKKNALNDAQAALADYSIRAPLSGTVAKFSLKVGDSVSPGTAVATLITSQRTAVLSLNEVDVAKVALGQKATLTFDAISDLTIAGTVSQIDALGTVSQGVVTYSVTIGFDTQDDRVKPGMSVSASIITNVKTDALIVPNSAIKSVSGGSYVQMLDAAGVPIQHPVETGLVNDTNTEIISGINEGDEVVIRTVTAAAAQSSAPSAASLLGGTRTGGNVRTPVR